MQDYAFTRSRIFQWMGILLSLGIIAVGYWYYQSQASTTINKNLSDSLATGLNLYWPLDDGTSGTTPTTAADSSPNGNTGTLTSGGPPSPAWTTGQVVNAVDLDGTDDYVTVADPASGVLDFADSTNFTLSGWFNRDTFTTDDTIIAKSNGQAAGDTGYVVYVDDTNDDLVFDITDGTDEYSRTSTATFTATGWNHFVAVFEDAVGMTIYINGSLNQDAASGTLGNIGSLANAVAFRAGAESDAGNPFDGKLDEVRLYNRALSIDEVTQLYRLTTPTGTETSLKGYWPFDGDDVSGTTTYDRSGVGSTGTLTNGPTLTRGKIGQAISFDGNNDKVALTDNAVFDVGGAGTWCNWFYSTANQSSRGMFSHNVSGGNYVMINGYLTTNSSVLSGYVRVGTTAYTATTPTYSTGYWNNQWHHVCTTFDKTLSSQRLKVYADGVLLGTHDAANGDIDAGNSPMVGNWVFGGGDQTSFQGYIDDMRMYNRALTVAEIKSLYDRGQSDKVNTSATQPQGTGNLDSGLVAYYPLDDGSGSNATDSSTNGATGTLNNFPGSPWTTGQIGGGLTIDGSDDYITAGTGTQTQLTSVVSLSAWVYLSSAPSNGQVRYIIRKYSSGDAGVLYELGIGNNVVGPTVFFRPGGGGNNNYDTKILSTGQWYHVAATYNQPTVTFYVDGVPTSTVTDTALGGFASGSGTFRMGGIGTAATTIDGTLDEIRVYNRALSAEEMAQLYRVTTPTSVDTGLKGYWSFNAQDMSGTTAYDRSGAGNTGTLTNGPTKAVGKLGQGIDFDGSNDYVSIADNAALDIGDTEDLTLTGWFNRDTITTDDTIIAKRNGIANTDDGYILYIDDTTDKLTFEVSENSGTDEYQLESTTTFGPGWNHFAVVWDQDSASASEIYLNGVANNATDTGTIGSLGDLGNSVVLAIGAESDAGDPFDGKLDEVRVYKRVITAAEIKSQYDLGEADKANTSISQPQGSGRLDSGLVNYWKFDENTGTSTTDSSTNAFTGTLTNGPTWTTGQIGSAINFDGTNDYVTATDSDDSKYTGELTLCVWANIETAGNYRHFMGKHASGGGTVNPFDFRTSTDNPPKMVLVRANADYRSYNGPDTTLGQWKHYCVVAPAAIETTPTFYIDGVPTIGLASGGTGTGAPTGSGAAIRMGSRADATPLMDGSMDEVRIYNRMLSADEIGQIYRLGASTATETSLKGYWSFNGQDVSGTTAYDRSGAGNTGTLTNSPTKSIGKVGQALSFDGTDDYVTAADSASLDVGTTNTFSAWFKLNAIPSVNGPIIRKFQSSVEDKVLFVNSDGTVGYYLYDTMGGSSLLSKTVVVANTWYHVAGTYDGTTARIYINGVLDNTKSASGNVADGTGVFDIGRGTNGGPYYFNGQIDEVRAYDRALSATEITALYNQGR